MNLTELVTQLEEIKTYCDLHDIATDNVYIFARHIDGAKREVSELYSLIRTKRMVVLDYE